MRRRTWLRLVVVALVALAVPVAFYLHAGTVHPECAGNTTCEMSRRDADMAGEFAVGLACSHAPSATLAVIAVAPCQAYAADGTYIEWTQDVGWTYNQGDGTYYWGVHKSPGTAVTGWTTVAGTPYRWVKSATLPVVTDPGFVLMGSATVGGTAVTATSELVPRRFQPRAQLATVPLGVTRWLGSCPVAGRWPLWRADTATSGTVAFTTPCTVFPEWWGATGDGVTLDGMALWGMIGGVNASTPAQLPLTIHFGPGRTYLITGSPNQSGAGWMQQGLRTLDKSQVEIVAYHSELKVPAAYAWVNNDATDPADPRQEAKGLTITGTGVTIRGGLWNGNLSARDIRRGPMGGPWDGAENGITFGKTATAYRIEDAIVQEWGTDNLRIQVSVDGGLIRNTIFNRPRRNNVSIVQNDVDHDADRRQADHLRGLRVSPCGAIPRRVVAAGRWGAHRGHRGRGRQVAMHLINNIFVNNRNGNVLLAQPGYRHIIKNNFFRGVYSVEGGEQNEVGGDALPTFPGGIVAPPGDKGGHVVQGNVFEDHGLTIESKNDDEPWVVTGNIFKSGTEIPVYMIPEGGGPAPSGWVVTGNSAPLVSKNVESYIVGVGHKVGYNAFKNPPQFVHNTTVAANATGTLDLQAYLEGTATYLVVVKGNGGGGAYDPAAIYLLSFNGLTLEGAWDLLPPNLAYGPATTDPDVTFTAPVGNCPASAGRKITRSGTVITFDNTTCNSTSWYGVMAYQIGRGDFGT